MSDVATWKVITDDRNPNDLDDGHCVIQGWASGADPARNVPSVVLSVEVGGLALADLIVASLVATRSVAENALAAHVAGDRAIDPRGWRYGPDCATCGGSGSVSVPDLPWITGHCNCKRGRRLLDLHIAEKARDDAEHEAGLDELRGGREHPDDPPPSDPDGSPF